MGLFTISQYADTLSEPFGLLRTLDGATVERDAWGDVRHRAGNASAVFRIRHRGRTLSLKCFTKQGLHAREIYAYTASHDDPLLTQAALLRDEITVYDHTGTGRCADVVLAEWVEGVTLETEIKRAVREYGEGRLGELSHMFDLLAARLLDREWAHGDVKPANIVVTPDDTLKLIDYDAMFIPSLAGKATSETGTPAYQHPGRGTSDFGKFIDDYPIALISVSLRALALDRGLWERYNGSDNLILYPWQIADGSAPALPRITELFTARGDTAALWMLGELKAGKMSISGLREALTGGI